MSHKQVSHSEAFPSEKIDKISILFLILFTQMWELNSTHLQSWSTIGQFWEKRLS